MKIKKVVINLSGGMDSTVLLYSCFQACDEIYALCFNYGQKHHWEIGYAKHHAENLNIRSFKEIDLKFFKDIVTSSSLTNSAIPVAQTKDSQGEAQTVNYVPCRNTMLLSIACAYAESVGAAEVIHGATQLDTLAGFWDGSKEYLQKVNELMSLNRKTRIKITAPLIDLSKKEIIEMGVKSGVDFRMTHTCYNPSQRSTGVRGEVDIISCGKCTSCGGRLKGFIDAGIKDPLPYEIDIPWEKYGIK